MKKFKLPIILLLVFYGTFYLNAQGDEPTHDDILNIRICLVERSQVCRNNTDYPNCDSVDIEDLDKLLEDKLRVPITIPPKQVFYSSSDQLKNLFYDINSFMDEYDSKNFNIDYNSRKSLLLIIRNDYHDNEKIIIRRYKCETPTREPISEYATDSTITLRHKERWFNHQNALFFHPAYKCKFEIMAESRKKRWIFNFMK